MENCMGLAGMVFPVFNDPHLYTPTLPEYIVSSGHGENWLIYKTLWTAG